jgi:hypothetical protein
VGSDGYEDLIEHSVEISHGSVTVPPAVREMWRARKKRPVVARISGFTLKSTPT